MNILKKEVFISVDIETSGPIPGDFSLLSIGACVVDDEDIIFNCELKPINKNADPKALEIIGLSLETFEKRGLPPKQAMINFNEWLKTIANEDTIVFVGFNASFDWSFINYYFWKYLGHNPFGFTALDIKSYYMGATQCNWMETKSSKIAQKLHPKQTGNHNPLQDAIYQAEIFRIIRKLNKPKINLVD